MTFKLCTCRADILPTFTRICSMLFWIEVIYVLSKRATPMKYLTNGSPRLRIVCSRQHFRWTGVSELTYFGSDYFQSFAAGPVGTVVKRKRIETMIYTLDAARRSTGILTVGREPPRGYHTLTHNNSRWNQTMWSVQDKNRVTSYLIWALSHYLTLIESLLK